MDENQNVKDFFGFVEHPFAPTSDPVYFYAAKAHKECLFRIWNSIDERHGIAVVLGDYGTGKTTLLRKILTGMAAEPEKYNTAVVASPIPSWSSFALLESIVIQFGITPPPEKTFASYMETLNNYLLEKRTFINTLIIDDSQNLNKRGQIELLRLIQNLETPQNKLVNLLLMAQMEWVNVLKAAPDLKQRINTTYTLTPLMDVNEAKELISFRINQAETDPIKLPLFDDAAIRVLYAYSEGNPRVIVNLCRNVLFMAAKTGTRDISDELVLYTIDKTMVPGPEKKAKVAMAVMDLIGTNNNENIDSIESNHKNSIWTEQHQHPFENRASQILLKAARTRSKRNIEILDKKDEHE